MKRHWTGDASLITSLERSALLRPLRGPASRLVSSVLKSLGRQALARRPLVIEEISPGRIDTARSSFSQAGDQPTPLDLQLQSDGLISILAGWNGTEPVGLCFVHWRGPRDASLAVRWPGVPEIYRLRVARRFRSLGVGTRLIRHAEIMAAQRLMPCIGMGVHDDNPRARELYVRLGYVPDPVPFVDRYTTARSDGQEQRIEARSTFLVKRLAAFEQVHALP